MRRVSMCIVKLVFRVIHNAGHLRHNDGSECIAANIDHGTEAIKEPINSDNNGVHASDGDVDGACTCQDLLNKSFDVVQTHRKS